MIKIVGKRPNTLGVVEGKLSRCSPKPNCVCSQYEDDPHFIEPIFVQGDFPSVWTKLKQYLESSSHVRIINESPIYIYAEFSTKLLGFVDDVEFHAVPEKRLIHVRSASRLGVRDFGVNRERIETIRQTLTQ